MLGVTGGGERVVWRWGAPPVFIALVTNHTVLTSLHFLAKAPLKAIIYNTKAARIRKVKR